MSKIFFVDGRPISWLCFVALRVANVCVIRTWETSLEWGVGALVSSVNNCLTWRAGYEILSNLCQRMVQEQRGLLCQGSGVDTR